MAIELTELGTLTLTLQRPIQMKDTPSGTRFLVDITDAVFKGERFNATKAPIAAADLATYTEDGSLTLDCRLTLETDDGAHLLVTYAGRGDLSEDPRGAPRYSAMIFQTGDERYRWLNKILTVAKGTPDGATLTYEVYQVS